MNQAIVRLLPLIRELASLPKESEWVEFKENNADPEEIGEYISALANAAALHGKPFGYLVWGVRDRTQDLVGTSFRPREDKVKGQELENWLSTQLYPRIHFRIHEADEKACISSSSRSPPQRTRPSDSRIGSTFGSGRTRRSSATTRRSSAACGRSSPAPRSKRRSRCRMRRQSRCSP